MCWRFNQRLLPLLCIVTKSTMNLRGGSHTLYKSNIQHIQRTAASANLVYFYSFVSFLEVLFRQINTYNGVCIRALKNGDANENTFCGLHDLWSELLVPLQDEFG